jgi:hypothetical protein
MTGGEENYPPLSNRKQSGLSITQLQLAITARTKIFIRFGVVRPIK